MFVSMLGLGLTSCEYVEDYLDYSKLTIVESTAQLEYGHSAYKNFKIVFNDKEYTSYGTYKIPNNTIVKLSWSFNTDDWWRTASAELMIGERETVTVQLYNGTIKVERDFLF